MQQLVLANEVIAQNVTFTPLQWSQFGAQVGQQMQTTLWTGLIIGAAVTAACIFIGQWFYGRKKE